MVTVKYLCSTDLQTEVTYNNIQYVPLPQIQYNAMITLHIFPYFSQQILFVIVAAVIVIVDVTFSYIQIQIYIHIYIFLLFLLV